jgi:hypothetical protein
MNPTYGSSYPLAEHRERVAPLPRYRPLATSLAPPHIRDYQRGRLLRWVELFKIHNSRKPRPLGLRSRVVLTESDTKRLEWRMS